MITVNDVLKNLKELIGQEFDEDEIIYAFEDLEEDGETEVYVGKSHNNGYDKIAYINSRNSTQFLFTTEKNEDDEEIITDVWMV